MVEQIQAVVGSEAYQRFLNNGNRRNSHTTGKVDTEETFHVPYVFSTCVPIYTASILPFLDQIVHVTFTLIKKT